MARLENLLGASALATSDRIRRADLGSAPDVPTTQREALVSVLAHPGRSVAWLGAVLGLTSSGATRLLERLVSSGWVRSAPGSDARRREIELTASGEAMARRILRAREAALATVVGGLSASQQAELERLLARLVAASATERIEAERVCRLCDRDACCEGEQQCPLEPV